MSVSNHQWSFSTVGGVKRVNLESGNDLLHLDELDQKLWTALSCPVTGLEIDHQTLSLIDTNKDGQIRVPEIIAAVKWVCAVLNNPDSLLKQEQGLPLAEINTSTREGAQLLASAKIILNNLGKPNAETLYVEDTSDISGIFAATPFNGDGIITVDSASSPAIAQLIEDIMLCCGSVMDRSGKPGISEEIIHNFFEQLNAYITWWKKSEDQQIMPMASATANAFEKLKAVEEKMDDYFVRCRLAAFDHDSLQTLNVLKERVEAISDKNLHTCLDEIAQYPLSKVLPGKALSLVDGLNPAWEKQMLEFKQVIIDQRYQAKTELTEQEWNELKNLFAPYQQWLLEEAGKAVAPLGMERCLSILSGNGKAELLALIAQDKALEEESNHIILVDQLVRYYRDLFRLLKNFVTFYDFYSPGSNAIFLAGTLYIDQRSCDLCIKVNDMAKHQTMVSFSGMYLLYCECTSRSTDEKMTIVAALTNGDIDNMVVGRNALFYDKSGKDWDATVIKIVDNPISIRQAFWSPYRKVSRFIEAQINKFASSQESKVDSTTTSKIETLPTKLEAEAPKAAPAPFDVSKFVGVFAAIALAMGAIGTAVASFISGFLGLVWWKIPFAVAGLLLVISGPSMIIAYLKLRKRNLAPILDANGWAVNARATINIPFGNTLTHLAELPHGAVINLNDPFTKKKRPLWPFILLVLLLSGILIFALLKFGYLRLPTF